MILLKKCDEEASDEEDAGANEDEGEGGENSDDEFAGEDESGVMTTISVHYHLV